MIRLWRDIYVTNHQRLSLLIAVSVSSWHWLLGTYSAVPVSRSCSTPLTFCTTEKTDLDHFVYNNTTYVPLRKVAELFGKEVTWEKATKTVNILDKKADGFYTESDAVSAALIADVDGNTLNLSSSFQQQYRRGCYNNFVLSFYDYAVYDEAGNEVYRHSEEYPFSILPIVDEAISSGGKFTVNEKLDLTAKDFVPGETYRAEFFTSFEMDSVMYKMCEDTYFKIPN